MGALTLSLTARTRWAGSPTQRGSQDDRIWQLQELNPVDFAPSSWHYGPQPWGKASGGLCHLFHPHFSISFFPCTENEGFIMRLEAQEVPSIFLLVTWNGSSRIIKDLVFTSKHWESGRCLHPVKCVSEMILFLKLIRLSAHQPLRSQSFWLEF